MNRENGKKVEGTLSRQKELLKWSLFNTASERKTPLEEEMVYHQCRYQAQVEKRVDSKIEYLMGYLAAFPLGKHNGEVAQEIEYLIEELEDQLRREKYDGVFRGMRDSWMPDIEPRI